MTRDEMDGAVLEKLLEVSGGDYVHYKDDDGEMKQALPLGIPRHLIRQFDHILKKETVG